MIKTVLKARTLLIRELNLNLMRNFKAKKNLIKVIFTIIRVSPKYKVKRRCELKKRAKAQFNQL